MTITNYRKAWVDYKKTEEYKAISKELKSKGIKQPYRDNIIQGAFSAGWNATETEIRFLKT